jgi:hypothetical protein
VRTRPAVGDIYRLSRMLHQCYSRVLWFIRNFSKVKISLLQAIEAHKVARG